jgi:hypothetical protein
LNGAETVPGHYFEFGIDQVNHFMQGAALDIFIVDLVIGPVRIEIE